ncbi:MAG: hypothetical protein H6742_03155 [Alphaproteobacteria bacterium]|nr:hypothetical protein [Alphaproteobacteria bacterium]
MAEHPLHSLRTGLAPSPAQVRRVVARARAAHRRRRALGFVLPAAVLFAVASLIVVRPVPPGPADPVATLDDLDLWPPTCELVDHEPLECPT